jgi:hypothetical protein
MNGDEDKRNNNNKKKKSPIDYSYIFVSLTTKMPLLFFCFKIRTSDSNLNLIRSKVEIIINTVYATRFIYYPLLENVIFIATCFGSVEPSSSNIHRILRSSYTCNTQQDAKPSYEK